jgi:8-oxo-dGTP pyrophosphatase MutT (NUDIX family)
MIVMTETPASARPVQLRPKDAATLLIVRRDTPKPTVLMGRRHRGNAFMPDKWVFPGGRIAPGDFRVPVARELLPDVAAALSRTAPAARARALALAAIRETYEETGLLLGQRVANGTGRAPASRGIWGEFLRENVLPDLGALDFVARAITPPSRPRRFDARFLLADAEALVSIDPGTGTGELDELAWFDWEAALALDLPSITRVILHEVALRLDTPARPIPFHHFTRTGHRQDVV